ncbi:acyl-CoA thioesterase [Dyella tabacisoli]|uniref:Acyl-CoA thioesterase n=1 Tax=Dyella tabacisoli TaxID=2282381 RepID=A0A369UR12_9GAMM|nr:thioesterase family protein [Dyella tabacisoli]RDD83086.1 acyl-CoA thioesterase [Dyella tabacisoli]
MAFEFKLRRLVEFHETDSAGVVHFSNFFRYCEITEAAFLRSLGLTLHRADHAWVWPRIDAQCSFLKPARFGDELEIHLLVVRKSEKTIEYMYAIHVLGAAAATLVAQARIVVACASWSESAQSLKARPLPPELNELVEEAPQDVLGSSLRRVGRVG